MTRKRQYSLPYRVLPVQKLKISAPGFPKVEMSPQWFYRVAQNPQFCRRFIWLDAIGLLKPKQWCKRLKKKGQLWRLSASLWGDLFLSGRRVPSSRRGGIWRGPLAGRRKQLSGLIRWVCNWWMQGYGGCVNSTKIL